MKIKTFLLIAMTLIGSKLVAQPSPTTRPNIVLFIADDLTWQDIGPYGGDDVRTPNLDRLAKESMKFERAYAASPTCTPSRSAMYTGMYPMHNGAHSNHSLVNDGTTTLPVYMKNLGYRVVIAGKTHIGPRPLFPFEYLPHSNIMPPGKHELLWTDLNTAAVDELLKTHDQKQPLCLVVATHSPHVYWMDNDGYEEKTIRIPPYLLDTPKTRYWRCKYYTDISHMDEQLGAVRASLEKYHYADNTLLMFTADQGAQWPFSKWSLYEAGIHTPLLIHWPGKVKQATTTDAMVSLIDLLPTMIQAAGGTPPGQPIDGRSFLDVLLAKTNHHRDEIYAAHTGDLEMNHAPMRSVRIGNWKYIHNLRPDIRYTTHISEAGPMDGKDYWESWLELAKTDPAAKKMVDKYYIKPPEELYDLEKDPSELTNLADDPKYASKLSELREKVNHWRLQQGEDLNKAPMPEDARRGNLRYAG